MKSLIALGALFVPVVLAWSGEPLLVPIEAHELIGARGCSQVSDFFEHRPAVERPPFALESGDYGKLSVAVWCQAPAEKPRAAPAYDLLFRVDDPKSPFYQCPRAIAGIEQIGGLRFIDVSEAAASFFYVDDKRPIKKQGKLITKGVQSEYDGVAEIYICVDGRWAFQALD
jgi:hypothetical protein